MASSSEQLNGPNSFVEETKDVGFISNIWQRFKTFSYWRRGTINTTSNEEEEGESTTSSSSRKRMRSHSHQGATPRPPRLEEEKAIGGGDTVARQAPIAQQQRRRRDWYEDKNDDPMSPLPSFPRSHQQQQQYYEAMHDDSTNNNFATQFSSSHNKKIQQQQHHQQTAGQRRSVSAFATTTTADIVRAQQQGRAATHSNPWALPIPQRSVRKADSVPRRPGSSLVISDPKLSDAAASAVTLGARSTTATVSSLGQGSLLTTSSSAATTRRLFSGATTVTANYGGRSSTATTLTRPPMHHPARRLHPGSNNDRDDDDDYSAATYIEDDMLSAATLAARVREAQQLLEKRHEESAAGRKQIRDNASHFEAEDNRLRALYNMLLLEVVEEETMSVVHGLVSRTDGALDAFVRSLVVPAVTTLLPTPRGVLKHIKSGGTVFLPVELDGEDHAEIDRICPLPAAPPPLSQQLSSSSSSATTMASSWLSSLASGGMKAMSHFTSSSSSNSINTAAVASQGDQEAFVVDDEGYQIRRYQLASLRGVTWVNDQVINYYFHLIQRQFPDVTSLGSHLYAKLAAGDMAGALRWVRRRDIFSSRVILIAINLNNAHWTLAVVDMEMKKLSYYDSLQGEGSYDVVLQRIAGFMDQAYAAKHDGRLPDESFATWPRSTDPNLRAKYYDNLPRQSNNNDCGVFVTQFGLCAACGIAPDFTQQDISLLRNVIMLELSQKKMLKRIHR